MRYGDLIDAFYECPDVEVEDNHGVPLYKGNSFDSPLEIDELEIKELRQGDVLKIVVFR